MNLLDVKDLSAIQITDIFNLADRLIGENHKQSLAGKTFILFFPESSLRTRITFEKGIKELGGECILFPPETLDKREELRDVIKYISNWADCMIVRHSDFSKLQELCRHSDIPVINAMTSDNHPCEILSDLYSISKRREHFKELVYTFVGPPGNIFKSWMHVSRVLNLNFNHVCTSDYQIGENTRNYQFHTNLERILMDSDVILTDSLPKELRTTEYIDKYQISLARMKLTKRNAMLNPCPPFFRGEEVHEDVIASDYFVGYEFKKNLLYVQQAIVLYCLLD
ncbi:ornithine carbamoyltransferase [Paenibacillus sp. Marseille-Q4541]|uniref:ornithine carbamoyltransferase n=1 Tax=Paenibacillus sp. Marseille-Q4541 TaxID=2831522 RepID=UPI001BA93336|nr:ornithine carbamoyltransferase [Paenibacillus sp. Marseille-Q4541]